MDFTRLVTNGDYSINDLPESRKAYIHGMDRAIEEVDYFFENAIEGDEMDMDSPTLDKIKKEITKSVLVDFKQWITSVRNELIVTFADEVICDET